jgi:DNA polymerase alpha subunit A
MPSVQVALREIARGKNPRMNDVMSYIITGNGKDSSQSAAKRAYSPEDVRKPDSGLKPDIEWYLIKQMYPPIERLCAPIGGTDAVRLAECLGLDTRKYQINNGTNQDQNEIFPLESQIDDEVRFKDAARFSVRCRACKESFIFDGLNSTPDACTKDGLMCPRSECGSQVTMLSLVAQLEAQIRQQTSRYYSAYLVCDDPSCGSRTRQMSVYGHRCLGPKGLGHGCLGRMNYEYTEKAMYNQLLYFQSLWDVEKAKKKAEGESKERIGILAEYNRKRFETPAGIVEAYAKKCGRVWVQMDSLFNFALKKT